MLNLKPKYKMRTEEIKELAEKYADELSGEGDYFEEIEKAVVFGASKFEQQLFVEERQNEMLITECEDLKSAVVVAEEQRDRLQANLIDKEEVNAELRQTIIALQQRQIKLENLLAPHQELTQWIEEEIMDENDLDVSHDFIQILYNKVYKINH